jgi:arginyl-tRNA synthetase
MVEFSQPNTHKVFHVGHLRNVAVGDALQRVHRARGHDVVAANYYGDFGIDVAKCLWDLDAHPDEEPPATDRCTWLGKKYVTANDRIAAAGEGTPERAAIMARLKEILELIKAGDERFASLYRTTRAWCLEEFAEVYRWLGVHFDTEFFESEVEEPAQRIVDEYLAKGVFVPSQGAVICDLEEEGLGAALVRKTDGTSLYLTWDLYLAQVKFDEHDVQRSLYVVGSEQSHHFRQLFATLKRMGYERADDCRHVPYELVMLPAGKMSSRKGNVVYLSDLRRSITDAIESKMRGGAEDEAGGGSVDRASWSAERWADTVHKVAVACLRYGMLKSSNTTRVIFDVEDWTNLTGDSGAYLLYSLARISGILRRADAPPPDVLAAAAAACAELGEPAERMLLGHLLLYPRTLEAVERTCDPSLLATWLYDGAKLFSRFYHDCPVLKASPPVRAARLGLVTATRAVMGRGLRAIGIEPVDEM